MVPGNLFFFHNITIVTSAIVAIIENIMLEYVVSLNLPKAIPVLCTLTRLKKFGMIAFSSPKLKF